MIGKTIEEITIGDSTSQTVLVTEQNVHTFGHITKDLNPIHFDPDYAATTIFKAPISHGMYVASFFSKLFGVDLPGYGSIYISQNINFLAPVYFDDEITVTVTATHIDEARNRATFDCIAVNQNGKTVIQGAATLMPPKAPK